MAQHGLRDAEAEQPPLAASSLASQSQRLALWAVLEPMLLALERGDAPSFERAVDAVEQHLVAIEREDVDASARLRAMVDRVAMAAEGLNGVA